MATWDVIVIGGGCSGLAAATSLSEMGRRVLVVEKRAILGGRASSFQDATTGERIDNGQHLLLENYQETKKYLKRIGSFSKVFFQPQLDLSMVGPHSSLARLRSFPLPAPFHLVSALLFYRGLDLKDRLNTYRVIQSIRKNELPAMNVSASDWLNQLKQSPQSRSRFWDPLILATLNQVPDLVSAPLLITVLQKGFLTSSQGSGLGWSRVNLTELHGIPSQEFILARKGEVRCRTVAKKLIIQKGKITGVEFFNGQREEAPCVISSVPPIDVNSFFSGILLSLERELDPLLEMIPSSILSVHLWVDSIPFPTPLIGFWDSPFHWAFRSDLIGQNPQSQHITVVTSAADSLAGRSKENLVALAHSELLKIYPTWSKPIRHSVVYWEPQATWIPPLRLSFHRPGSQTGLPNFFLAGDWTDTGLPATIESAVQSGHQAAQCVHQFLTLPK